MSTFSDPTTGEWPDLCWPTRLNLTRDFVTLFPSTAIWRQDRQTYAVLVDDDKGGWIGQQHGQFPTIPAMIDGLAWENYEPFEYAEESLQKLGQQTRQNVGPSWLVGDQSHGEAVLAVVHPDQSITRLDPQWNVFRHHIPRHEDPYINPDDPVPPDPIITFGWGPGDSGGMLETAKAAYQAAMGDKHTNGWRADALIAAGFADLPDRFAVELDAIAGTSARVNPTRRVTVRSNEPAIKVLTNDIAVRGVNPPTRQPEWPAPGLSR